MSLTEDGPLSCNLKDVSRYLGLIVWAIPEDAIKEAIRAARESSISVAIASGRAWNEMNDVIEKYINACLQFYITNGAYVMRQGWKIAKFIPINW